MKIAVVGAGFFGITAALKLSKFHEVSLFDIKDDILTSASRTNQLRLHRGYHYPRSKETVDSLLKSLPKFLDFYGEASIDDYDHHYAIASENSFLNAKQYLNFLDSCNLEYEVVYKNNTFVNPKKIETLVKVKESLLDYHKIYSLCKEMLIDSEIDLRLNEEFCSNMANNYDYVINCTYSTLNELTPWEKRREYQFEVCEKICVKAPKSLIGVSLVVMDGPFMCIDPYGKTGNSLLGNVVHAIHTSNIGQRPIVPDHIAPYLNKGIVNVRSLSNFDKFIESGKHYINELENCEYVGSMFTVRSVLPYVDDSDERPTIVTPMDGKFINVFSGKIDTCVQAADEIMEFLNL